MKSNYRHLIQSQPLLLDLYPGAQAAYALRKLRTAYAGMCVQVRRSSDNTVANIGFIGATLDTVALLNFVGAGNGFVTIWYDQSGNGINLIQTTQSKQFGICIAGSLFFEGTDIVLDGSTTNRQFDRATNTVILPDYTVLLKSKMVNSYGTFIGFGSSSHGLLQHNLAGGFCYYDGAYKTISGGNGGYSAAYRKLAAKRVSSTTTLSGYINGVLSGNVSTLSVGLTISTGCRVFGDFAGDGYKGTVREMIIYPTALSDSVITSINTLM